MRDSFPSRVFGFLGRAGNKLEHALLQWIIETRGVSRAVRYLRNPDPSISIGLLRAFGAEVGAGTTIKRSLRLDNVFRDRNSTGDFRHIKIGRNCYIGDGVYFDLANRIVVHDEAIFSGDVSVVTHADCNRSTYLSDRFSRKCAPVQVEKGAWIGFGATLLAGAKIGANSVVAAHSLVKGEVEQKSLYAGEPATKVKDIK